MRWRFRIPAAAALTATFFWLYGPAGFVVAAMFVGAGIVDILRRRRRRPMEEMTPVKLLTTGEETTGTPSPPRKVQLRRSRR